MKAVLWARRAVYICVLLGALMGQLFDVGWIFHFIFFFVLTLPPLSLLLSLPGILGLRVCLSASHREVRRGAPASWVLSIENRFGLPVARVTARVRTNCAFTGESSRMTAVLRGAAPGMSSSWEAGTGHCGRIECSVDRLRVWDCLGLIALPLGRIAPGTMLVAPLEEFPVRLVLPDSTGASLPVPSGKAAFGEDYELRPYRDGDSLRTIHWKMSAKRDELVTRELLAQRRPLPVLTFDHFGSLEVMDRTLDRLAGYSQTLLEQERPHEVRWAEPASGAVRTFPVGCERDWSACLTAILSEPVPMEGQSIGTLRAEGPDESLFQIHIRGDAP